MLSKCRPDGTFITGSDFPMDGGVTAGLLVRRTRSEVIEGSRFWPKPDVSALINLNALLTMRRLGSKVRHQQIRR